MPVDLPAAERERVVSRLRAGGCVYAEAEAKLLIAESATPAELDHRVARRVDGEPFEQVLGWAEFCGHRVAVRPGVFVPRRRTEFLAERAAELVRPASVVLDLCCGAGAIGLALRAVAPIELYAAELDPVAADCARGNLGPDVPVYVGDLFAPIPPELRGRLDVIVANVPYVPSDDVALLPAEAREHEPRRALDGGPDGLAVLRRVATEAPNWLRPDGALLIETSERQAPLAAAAFRGAGLLTHVVASDELAAAVVVGTGRQTSG